MKTISLLERYGIATNPEARSIIKQTPILASIEENQPKYTLTQTLTPFPGQTVRVIGTSEFDPHTRKIHRISPKTFAIALESNQTGFPDPLQRAGWTLSHVLVHDYPQRIDYLQESVQVLQKKKLISATLLPHTQGLDKAKQLVKMKKKLFGENLQEFAALHKKLACLLAKNDSSFELDAIEQFFAALPTVANPFEWLSHAHQMAADLFIAQPQQALIHSILNDRFGKFGKKSENCFPNVSTSLEIIIKEAENQLQLQQEKANATTEQVKLYYVTQMGKVIGHASMPILLQYLSEDLMFPPPELKLFQQKLQALAYRHVLDFFEELSFSLDPGQVHSWMKKELLDDIALLEGGASGLEIPQELSKYFAFRHINLSIM